MTLISPNFAGPTPWIVWFQDIGSGTGFLKNWIQPDDPDRHSSIIHKIYKIPFFCPKILPIAHSDPNSVGYKVSDPVRFNPAPQPCEGWSLVSNNGMSWRVDGLLTDISSPSARIFLAINLTLFRCDYDRLFQGATIRDNIKRNILDIRTI